MAGQDQAGVRFPPPFVYLGFLLLGPLLGKLLGEPGFGLSLTQRLVAGLGLALMGIAIGAAAVGLFRKAGTDPAPWKPSTAIVRSGLYGITRNPMYVGMAVVYVGLALALDSVIAFLMLPIVLIVIQTQVIAREERYLETKFGDDYRRYKASVPRWL